MDDEIARLVRAVQVASLPPPSNDTERVIHTQAVNYLSQVQLSAGSDQVWKVALQLFIAKDNSANQRKYDSQVRLFALRLLEEFLDNK
jgi:hypothetical protein